LDRESFEILGDGYSKDYKNIYFYNSKVEDADLKTIKMIGEMSAEDKFSKFDGQGERY